MVTKQERERAKRERERNPRQLMELRFPDALKIGDKMFGGIEFLDWIARTQPQFSTTMNGLQAIARLQLAVKGKENGQPLHVEWRDVQLCREAVEQPKDGFPLTPPIENLRFCEALDDAEEYEQPAPADEEKES